MSFARKKLLILLVTAIAVSPGYAKRRGEPNDDAVALRRIVASQPDYVADVVYDTGDRDPSSLGWVSRIAKRGREYRIEVDSRRTAASGGLKRETIVIDRDGRRLGLDHDARTYFVTSELDWARACFMLPGLDPVELASFVTEVRPTTERTGAAEIGGRPCDVYRTPANFGGEYTVYVARDLKDLVVRMDFRPERGASARELFRLTNVVVDPPDLTDDMFRAPVDYALEVDDGDDS